ncbi:unnamed protein product [Boreogadus saida]
MELGHEQALSEGRVDELIGLYEAPFDRAPSSLPSPLHGRGSSGGSIHGSEASPHQYPWCGEPATVYPDAAREGEGCVDSRRCSSRRTTTGGGDSAGPGLSGGGGSSSGGSSNSDVGGASRPGADSGSEGAGGSPGSGACSAGASGAQTATGASTACPLSCLPGLPADGCCRSCCNWTFKSNTASPCGPLTAPAECVGAPRPLLTLPQTSPAPRVLPPLLAAAQHAGPELPVPLKNVYRRKLNAKRWAEAQPGTIISHRAGVPQVQKCSKCGQPRRRETGHSRYGREYFCCVAAGQSVEDWLREKKEGDPGGAPD